MAEISRPNNRYGSWIYNYLCNMCLSPLMFLVWISIRARCTTLFDKVCQWLATGRWFSQGPQVSSANKTDRHDITEILLKVALKHHQTKKQTNKPINRYNQNLFTDDWRSKCGISKQRSNLKTNILCYPEMAKSSKPLPIFIEKSSSNLFICFFFLVRALDVAVFYRLLYVNQGPEDCF